MKKYRKEKIERQIRREIAYILQGDIKDPRIKGFVNINNVKISNDFKEAKVYVSVFGVERDTERATFDGLKSSVGFIEYKLTKNLSMRSSPKITLIKDNSVEEGINVINKLDKISKELEDKNVEKQ